MNEKDTVVDTSDIDDLLDSELDDLADAPSFKPFAVGAHIVTINWEYTAINDQTAINLNLTLVETQELADETVVKGNPGDQSNVLFMLRKADGEPNKHAQGQLKELLKPLKAHFGGSTNKEVIELSEGAQCLVVTNVRAAKLSKEDRAQGIEPKYYTSVTNLQVL